MNTKGSIQAFVVTLIFVVIIVAGMGWAFISNFGSALPVSCDRDYICENQHTVTREGGGDDRWEGTVFSCLLTDCCYNDDQFTNGRSWEICVEEHDETFCESALANFNPEFLFSCVESGNICNEPGCYESCDYDSDCEDGEYILCADCW